VLADVVDSLGCKLVRNEPLYDVSCLIVLVPVIWPELMVVLRKLPQEQLTAMCTPQERSESRATSPAAKRKLNLSTSLGAVS